MLCEAACSSESRQLDLQIPVVGDSAMLLEYMTSCAQLCGEPGCDIRAHLDMLEEGAHVIRLQVRVSYERTVEATMQQQLAQLQTRTPASLASTELALTDLGEERHKEALEKVLQWFTAKLRSVTGESEAEEDEAFVKLGRTLLHTKATSVSFAPTVQSMHRDLWALVEAAPFLADRSGGGALFVAPQFTHFEAFDDFTNLVRAGLRHLVNAELEVQAYHPLHPQMQRRGPVPVLHLFLDSQELFIMRDAGFAV